MTPKPILNCGACTRDRTIPCTCTFIAQGGRFVEDATGKLHAYTEPKR